MMKKVMVIFLSIICLGIFNSYAYAASDEAVSAANELYKMSLFGGAEIDSSGKPIFDLDRTPTRDEAITMLVRLLGQTGAAENGEWHLPFSDIEDWAKPYVGYAYANNLASGTTATNFEGKSPVSASQYITFVLRALDYESGIDFQWDKSWELSDKLGITNGQYNSTSNFTRGDVVIISYNALKVCPKGTTKTLEQILIENGTIKQRELKTENNIPENEKDKLLNAYAEEMYYVMGQLSFIICAQEELQNNNVEKTVYYINLCQAAEGREVVALEEMKTICGDYYDTQNLKKNIEERIQLIRSLPAEAFSHISAMGEEDYSQAYSANTDVRDAEMYKLLGEDRVKQTAKEYIKMHLKDE